MVMAIGLLVSPIIISEFFIGVAIVSKKSFLDLPFLSMMQYIISSMMEAGVSSLIMMMASESMVAATVASITSIVLLLMEPSALAVGESSERKKTKPCVLTNQLDYIKPIKHAGSLA